MSSLVPPISGPQGGDRAAYFTAEAPQERAFISPETIERIKFVVAIALIVSVAALIGAGVAMGITAAIIFTGGGALLPIGISLGIAAGSGGLVGAVAVAVTLAILRMKVVQAQKASQLADPTAFTHGSCPPPPQDPSAHVWSNPAERFEVM